MAESMTLEDGQLDTAELGRKVAEGALEEFDPLIQLLTPNPRDRSRERRRDNRHDPLRRGINVEVGMKQKNVARGQTDILLVTNL